MVMLEIVDPLGVELRVEDVVQWHRQIVVNSLGFSLDVMSVDRVASLACDNTGLFPDPL